MRIEDHWHDAVEYYVSFETTNGRTIRKHLVLFEDLTDVEIKSWTDVNKVDRKKVNF